MKPIDRKPDSHRKHLRPSEKRPGEKLPIITALLSENPEPENRFEKGKHIAGGHFFFHGSARIV
jgi:hypothetical protein